MSKFKFGDRARYIGRPNGKAWPGKPIHAGKECTVLNFYSGQAVGQAVNVYISNGYWVVFDNDEEKYVVEEDWLEPILKRPELGSIEELSNILGGWMPSKNVEVV